jgi:hypothetical protein
MVSETRCGLQRQTLNRRRATILLLAWAVTRPVFADARSLVAVLEAPPPDFALRLEADGPAEVIDTERRQFQRMIRPGDTVAVSLPLSETQLPQIFRMVTEARLFEYPERFISPFSSAPFAPYPRYPISVTSGSRRHTIVWEAQGTRTRRGG